MSGPLSHGEFRGGEHRLALRVYYEDTDFSGYVYHANYVKFFERGRSEAIQAAGFSHSDLLRWDPPAAMVVRHMGIDFLKPALIEDDLVVVTKFHPVRGARMFADQRIERDGQVLASATVQIVMINLNGAPRRVPAAFIEQMASFLAL